MPHVLPLSLLFLLTVPLVAAAGKAQKPCTLAILTTDTGESRALADELMVKLATDKSLVLVDREHLKQITREQVLAGAGLALGERINIGRLVGADLLVLLTGTEKSVRLVMCDSHLGVTFLDLSLPTKDKTHDNMVTALADQTLRVVHQFESGIKHVVAVPDFVSRDLTFEHSFLQFDYAEVLRSAYRQIPGLALVAVEEAKAIAAERNVAGIEQKDRPVPVFIEGEYRTKRNPKDASATVEITLRARDTSKTLLEQKLPAVPLDQAGGQLLATFAKDLSGLTWAGGPTIDTDGQYRLLIQRAEEFSTLGEFRRSTALREAALLLKPDADDQRIQLVREYTRHNSNPIESKDRVDWAWKDDKDPIWMALVTQVVNDWKRALQHSEYLIHNRRLCSEEATDLTYHAIGSIASVRRNNSPQMKECEAIKKDFLRQAFARIAFLDPATTTYRRKLSGSLDVYQYLFESALVRCDGNYFDPDDLDLIADLLLTHLPESMSPCSSLTCFLSSVDAGLGRETQNKYYHFTDQQYQEFLDRLIASKRPLVRLYGRYGKYCLRRYGKQEKSSELLQEAKAIVTEAQKAGFDQSQYDSFRTTLRDEVTQLSRDLASKPRIASNPTPIPASQPTSRVSLEPIELTFIGIDRDSKKFSSGVCWRSCGGWWPIQGYRPLGDGLDAFWSKGAVLFMRLPGKGVQVLANEQLSVTDVIHDGRYVWVASAYEWGISVLDRTGKELVHISKEQGLPPCDRFGMVACPLAPGRILAAGSFGSEHRAWIAIVEFDGTKPKVEVILEATKVWDYKKNNQYNPDPAMTFIPQAMFAHVLPGPQPRRIIFILRKYNQPLLVDPETRKVWVYQITEWSRQCFPRMDPPDDAFYSIDGVLWIAGADRDFRSYRFNEETGLFQVVREKPDWHMGNDPAGSFARDGDWLYYAGNNNWRRINLRTGAEDLLVDDPHALPHYGSGNVWHLARSTHYGLVAYFAGTLYRVGIDENGPTTKP